MDILERQLDIETHTVKLVSSEKASIKINDWNIKLYEYIAIFDKIKWYWIIHTSTVWAWPAWTKAKRSTSKPRRSNGNKACWRTAATSLDNSSLEYCTR